MIPSGSFAQLYRAFNFISCMVSGGFNIMPCSKESTDSELTLSNKIINCKLVIIEKNKIDKLFHKKIK